MVRAIYFDYHGVLDRRTFAGFHRVLAEALPHASTDVEARIAPLGSAYAAGEMSPVQFWQAITEAYGPTVAQAGKKYLLHVDPIQPMWELINRLHEKFSIGLFSDCPMDKRDVIVRAYNLPEFFDQLIFSCDTRLTKVDPNFFRRMLRDGLYQPNECLLIDDSHQSIGQARSLGFQTHEFSSPTECINFCSRL